MDDFLNGVRALSSLAARRKPPSVDAEAILRSVAALEPPGRIPEPAAPRAAGFRFLVGFSAAAAAASIVIVLYAASAWAELNNPFLAMDAFTTTLGFLEQ